MPVRTRWLIQFATLAVALNATAAATYLPLIGPPALRFETPRVEPIQSQPQLPPLEPKPAPIPAPEVAADVPAQGTPAPLPTSDGSNAPGIKHPARPAGEILEGPAEPTPGPRPSTPADPSPGPVENLTPQMFMKFFTGRPGTNATGSSTTIFAPLPFIPPVPPAPPSSSATYQTTPPAKP